MPKIKPMLRSVPIQTIVPALVWTVASDSRDGQSHEVTFFEDSRKWSCTCEAFRFKKTCKHIDFIKEVGEY